MYIKIRKTDNVIFDSNKTDFDISDDFYSVEYTYKFPSVQPYYLYKWDVINEEVINNNNEDSIEFENRKRYSDLKIIKWIDDDVIKHQDFDFTLVLLKDEPLFHKGIKIMQDYLDPETEELIVRKYYQEIIGDRLIFGEISPNRILKLKIKIEWFGFDNNIGSTKEQIVKKFNREEEGERKYQRRQRQIANLKSMAMGTAAEPVVDAIYTYYDEEVRYYINQGTSVFLESLNNEENSTILYYLNIKIPRFHTEQLTITDYIENEESGNFEFTIEKDYLNCMLQFLETGTTINVVSDLPGYTESDDNQSIIFLGEFNNSYKFEIDDSNFIRQNANFILNWNNTIKDYIVHEIDDTKL